MPTKKTASKSICTFIPADVQQPMTPWTDTTLKGLQKAVGGHIERAELPPFTYGDRNADIFLVNEDGISEGLPVNPRANAIFMQKLKASGMTTRQLSYIPTYLGDVLLCKDKVLK